MAHGVVTVVGNQLHNPLLSSKSGQRVPVSAMIV